MKVGDKVMVRDGWIEADWMIPQGTIVEIGYYPNTNTPKVYLVQFENFKSVWFHHIALKTQ